MVWNNTSSLKLDFRMMPYASRRCAKSNKKFSTVHRRLSAESNDCFSHCVLIDETWKHFEGIFNESLAVESKVHRIFYKFVKNCNIKKLLGRSPYLSCGLCDAPKGAPLNSDALGLSHARLVSPDLCKWVMMWWGFTTFSSLSLVLLSLSLIHYPNSISTSRHKCCILQKPKTIVQLTLFLIHYHNGLPLFCVLFYGIKCSFQMFAPFSQFPYHFSCVLFFSLHSVINWKFWDWSKSQFLLHLNLFMYKQLCTGMYKTCTDCITNSE